MSRNPSFRMFSGHSNIPLYEEEGTKFGIDQRIRTGYGKFCTFWPSTIHKYIFHNDQNIFREGEESCPLRQPPCNPQKGHSLKVIVLLIMIIKTSTCTPDTAAAQLCLSSHNTSTLLTFYKRQARQLDTFGI